MIVATVKPVALHNVQARLPAKMIPAIIVGLPPIAMREMTASGMLDLQFRAALTLPLGGIATAATAIHAPLRRRAMQKAAIGMILGAACHHPAHHALPATA